MAEYVVAEDVVKCCHVWKCRVPCFKRWWRRLLHYLRNFCLKCFV